MEWDGISYGKYSVNQCQINSMTREVIAPRSNKKKNNTSLENEDSEGVTPASMEISIRHCCEQQQNNNNNKITVHIV